MARLEPTVTISPCSTTEPFDERLFGVKSIRRALRLRVAGLSYGDIAIVMGMYHGDYRCKDTWRTTLRAHGAPAKHYSSGLKRVPPSRRA